MRSSGRTLFVLPRAGWLAAAAVALLVPPDLAIRHAGVAGAIFDVMFALCLLGRARSPSLTFVAIAGVALVQWAVGVRVLGDVALLIALYSVVSRESAARAAAAAALLAGGITLASLTWLHNQEVVHDQIARNLATLLGIAAAVAVVGLIVRNRRAQIAELRKRTNQLERERDQEGQIAAAAERGRIARELHDVVAHNLTVMLALTDGAIATLDAREAAARSALETAGGIGRDALAQMRGLVGVLSAAEAEQNAHRPQPGLHDLPGLIDHVRATGLSVQAQIDAPPQLADALALTVYRIIQEGLTNALKHGGPGATATVTLTSTADNLRIEITNTTTTSPPKESGSGLGVRAMRERAAVHGGTLKAGPAGPGWTVTALLPLDGA